MRFLKSALSFSVLLLSAVSILSAPVKTVPWNGYKGAVSFTFDDGCESQLTNAIPALKTRGIHATFFLPGNSLGSNQSKWIQASRDGNEIANHSYSHPNLTTVSKNDSIVREVVSQAVAFRALDTSIQCVTFAYPNCATNDVIDSITNSEHIIARTCGGDAHFAWSSKPSNWMRMTSTIIFDSASAASALTAIDDASKANSWFVTLNHGVGGDWSSVETSKVTALFDRAIRDSVWIETYQNVAAYWRASFTMDTVKAVSNNSGWTLTWKSPHPKMPKSVVIKITLDPATFGSTFYVYQKNKLITKQTDGSYGIEFMDKELTITRGPITGTKWYKKQALSEIAPALRGSSIVFTSIVSDNYTYKLFNLSGKVLKQGTLDIGAGMHTPVISLKGVSSGLVVLQLAPLNNSSKHMTWRLTLE